MAGVVEALGTMAAVGQFIEQCLKIASLLMDLRSKMKVGPRSAHEQALYNQELIDLYLKIQQDTSEGEMKNPFLQSCLEDAIQLRDIFRRLSINAGDGSVKRLIKSVEWKAKEKEILRICTSLEQKKATLSLSMIRVLPGMASQVSVLNDKLSQFSLTVEERFAGLSLDVAALRLAHPQSEMQSTISSSSENSHEGLCTIRPAKNIQIIGRDALLEELASRLDRVDSQNRVALFGLDGVGKTQVALEYAKRLRKRSPETSLFWINADNRLCFEQDYLKIAQEAKLLRNSDSDPVSTRLVAERVKHWLSTKESCRWLLIIDDANNEDLVSGSKQLFGLIPESVYGSVIFTTRNKKTALKLVTSQNVIPVERLGLRDACELLSSVVGCKKSMKENMDKTFELLHTLEYLPLAITQAGSYISANCMSISGYLGDYNENEFTRIGLPNNQGCFEMRRTFNPSFLPSWDPVGRTSMLSIEQIRINDPDATDIISFMSCLGRQSIPRRLLPSPCGQSKLSSALETLKAYCLITAIDDDQLFDMHTLVRSLMQTYLRSQGTFEHWIQQSLTAISEKLSSNDTLTEGELYLPHAEMVLSQGLSAKNDAARVELAHRCGVYLQMRGQGEHNRARAINNQVLQQIIATSKEEHRATLCSMNNFAIDLLGQRMYSEAEEMNRIVLSRRMSVLGSDDAHTLASMSNLSYSLQLQERYEPARDLAEDAVRMKRKTLGSGHLDTLLSINNLGVLLQLQGDFEGSKKMHSEAISGRKASLGMHHPDTLISIGNLTGTFFAQRQFAKAEKMARKVYDGNIKIRGSHHPETIKSLSNLASALQLLENYEEAEKARRQVLRLREESLGHDHPDTIASAEKLEVLLQSRENQRVANGSTSDCPSRE